MRMSYRGLLSDFSASVVVYLVALPLCLGVAMASDTLPVTGVVAGIVGGVVVGIISKSPLSVSGPAAGLTAIVAGALTTLPSYEAFLFSLVIAGFFQFFFGFLNGGKIADYIPFSVINGLLAAIGLILILKQIPYFLGYANQFKGGEFDNIPGIKKIYSAPLEAIKNPDSGALFIGSVSLLILILFELMGLKKNSFFRYFPSPLLAVVAGTLLNLFFEHAFPEWFLSGGQLVTIPVFDSPVLLLSSLSFPDFSSINLWETWSVAIVIAIIASIETLLSIEAVDKLDSEKRVTPPNHELKAQGVGNIVSAFFGGLPITSVIVRSSANVQAGARSKYSTVFHGLLLLISLLFFPRFLNLIPLASLSAILIVTGYKLTKPSVYIEMKRRGLDQFVTFLITIIAILQTDLLKGVFIGMVSGFIFGVRSSFINAVTIMKDADRMVIRFGKEVSFLNEGVVKNNLRHVKDHMRVSIDATRSEFIDRDIVEAVNDFIKKARERGVVVYIRRSLNTGNKYFND